MCVFVEKETPHLGGAGWVWCSDGGLELEAEGEDDGVVGLGEVGLRTGQAVEVGVGVVGRLAVAVNVGAVDVEGLVAVA